MYWQIAAQVQILQQSRVHFYLSPLSFEWWTIWGLTGH
jgi:hypothetical protein